MMSPWKTVLTVGLHVPSSSSSAVCVLNMEEIRRTVHTKLVQVYFSMYVFNHFIPDDLYVLNHFIPDDLLHELVFFNTFEELHLPIKGPMEDSGVVKL